MTNHFQRKCNLVVLLTSCIDPGNTIAVARRDPNARLDDYKGALKNWLAIPGSEPIVFCDNSGYDLTEIEEVCKHHNHHDKRWEIMSFHGQDFPGRFGKGYGEMRIVSHAVAHSKTIKTSSLILKVSGRLFVSNARRLLSKLSQADRSIDVFCDLRKNLTTSDSRVFCASISFIRDHLLPLQEILNDSNGVTFEDVLAKAAHDAMFSGKKWSMLPLAHHMVGIAGTNGKAIPSSRLTLMKREVFRRIKSAVLCR